MKRHLLLLSTALLAFSCAENNITESPAASEEARRLSIDVAMPDGDTTTRIAVSEDADSGDWITSWEESDCLGGFSSGDSRFNEFAMEGTTDGVTAKFNGSISGDDLRLVYPYNAATPIRNSLYTINLAEQSVAIGSLDNLADNTHLISEQIIPTAAAESYSNKMKHIGAAMELTLRFKNIPDGCQARITEVEVSGDNIASAIDVNLGEEIDSDAFYTNKQSGSYTLKIADNSVANYDESDDTSYSIPFNILPFTVKRYRLITFTISITYTDANGDETQVRQIVTSKNTSSEVISFSRGTISSINKIVDMSGAESVAALDLKSISKENYPTESNIWVISDEVAELSDFKGLKEALGAANDEKRKISLVFPNLAEMPSATTSSAGALSDCYALVSVELAKASLVGAFAFSSCGLVTLKIPEATSIEKYAFYNCSAISSVNMPMMETIGDYAFYEHRMIDEISLPKVTSVGVYAFQSSNSRSTILAAVNLPRATTIGDSAFRGCGKLSVLNIPEAATLGVRAFASCGDIANVNLPNALSLGDYAFEWCEDLISINLPVATSIGGGAFACCYDLASIELPSVDVLGESVFSGCRSLTTVKARKLSKIKKNIFYDCATLSAVEIATSGHDKLITIDGDPFYCTDTSAITLTIGSKNAKYIDHNTLSVGSYSVEFKEIIVP